MNAFLHIQAGFKNDKTYLKKAYYTTPFKLANTTEDKSQPVLHLMLMSSSPGLLDGDNYNLRIELEENCSLQLHTQSYQRFFDMKKGASQNIEVFLDKNATFCFLPHPSVPHKSSDFVAINKIYLSNGCRLIWGEVLTCGRKLNGEEFQFSRYQNRTEIFLNKKLVVKENLVIKPSITNVKAIGQFEGFTHQASLIYIDEKANINKLIENINNWLSGIENICFGVSSLPVNGVIVRLLGYKGEQLFDCINTITDLFLKEAGNILPENIMDKPTFYAS